eukprot:258820-Rhodomonas_salina.3
MGSESPFFCWAARVHSLTHAAPSTMGKKSVRTGLKRVKVRPARLSCSEQYSEDAVIRVLAAVWIYWLRVG